MLRSAEHKLHAYIFVSYIPQKYTMTPGGRHQYSLDMSFRLVSNS